MQIKVIFLKTHSQLCDCADLDTSFSHFEKSLPQPKIKVHLEIRFIYFPPVFCLIFNHLLKNLFFKCPFAHPMILFLSYRVKQSGTVIKFDNLDQNNPLANQTPSLSSRDTLS